MSSTGSDASNAGSRPRVLGDLLLRLNGETGIRFITGSREERFRPYPEITADALAILGALQARAVAPRACVVVAVADPEAFVLAFWACILGGLVPVPVQPPANNEHRLKLQRILAKLDEPFLITDAPSGPTQASVAELLSAAAPLAAPCCSVDARRSCIYPVLVGIDRTSQRRGSDSRPAAPAFCRLRSQRCDRCGRCVPELVSLTHDMGLIGWHLIPLSIGATHCLLPTKLFVQRPALWLSKASEHRAGVLCTNNFGLKHFIKLLRPDTTAGWDLSAIRACITPRNRSQLISAKSS